MKNKVCLVTGANSGLGKITARVLAQLGASVLMVCRNRQKGELVLNETQAVNNACDLHLFVADLSSLAEIRRLAADINSHFPRIDVLINNAGAINPARSLTVDGLETTFAVNHLAGFLLSNLLLDQLRASTAPRIINVSSHAHKVGNMHFDDLGLEKNFNPMKAYAQSKLANILFTYELVRRLNGKNSGINAVHPGTVNTNFGKNLSGIGGIIFKSFAFLMRSPEHGAETMIWLATAPELTGVSGKYFFDKKEVRSSRISYDTSIARRLWDISKQLTGIGRG